MFKGVITSGGGFVGTMQTGDAFIRYGIIGMGDGYLGTVGPGSD